MIQKTQPIKTLWFLFTRWAIFPIVVALLLMLASCTQPSGKIIDPCTYQLPSNVIMVQDNYTGKYGLVSNDGKGFALFRGGYDFEQAFTPEYFSDTCMLKAEYITWERENMPNYHPLYPIDTVQVDTINHHISYSKNWE